jgi:hypothetical protein
MKRGLQVVHYLSKFTGVGLITELTLTWIHKNTLG